MKKLLIILLGAFTFACGNADNETEGTNNETTTEEDVEIGAGEEISPQLELEGDSAENFEVDTVSSAGEINQEDGL
ncbi:hypothetical protein [Pontibacter russatus]|uniref:hypothetical protein n=1 Tax=Pontibacter russatus TaxID=2694929 RepID=UPI00137AA379|nr:hypothetical protein [Pontibacter russatus]